MQPENWTRLVKRFLSLRTLFLGGTLLGLLHGQCYAALWAVTLTPGHVCEEVWNEKGGLTLQARFNHNDLPDGDLMLTANLVSNTASQKTYIGVSRDKPVVELFYDLEVLYATHPRVGGTKLGTVEFRVATLVPGYTGNKIWEMYSDNGPVVARADLFWDQPRNVSLAPVFNAMPNPVAIMQGAPVDLTFVVQYEGCRLQYPSAYVAYRYDPVNVSNVARTGIGTKIRGEKSQLGMGGSFTVDLEGAAIVAGAALVAPIFSRQVTDLIPLAVTLNSSSPGWIDKTFVFAAPAEGNINRPGSDYRHFDDTWFDSCQAKCSNEPQCKAWTWEYPVPPSKFGRCSLKTSVPEPNWNNCCVSGVKP